MTTAKYRLLAVFHFNALSFPPFSYSSFWWMPWTLRWPFKTSSRWPSSTTPPPSSSTFAPSKQTRPNFVSKRMMGPVWPDLSKFRRFGSFLKSLATSLRVYLVFGQNMSLLLKMLMLLSKFLFLKMARYWTNNLAKWSHWMGP